MARSKDLVVRLLGDASEFERTMKQASSGVTDLGKTMSKTITPVAAGIAVGMTKIGSSFNDARDAIIVGTGATGKAFDDLMKSTKRVSTQVPNDFGEVGQAIADVNTRLGLTGPELETTTKLFLDLSRVTKTDVSSNIANVTRVFGDWSVAVDDQASAMDTLFAATQQTGIGIDRLSQLVVQFGAPMRQLGFSLDESIALFGKFEQEGVNIETVMAGLRMGLGRMAKAGEEPIDTFQRLIAEIKNAGTAGEANAIALEGFGQRAGPDMAAAIREGRFEIDDLVASLGESDGALSSAAEGTLRLSDRFGMLRNRIIGAIGPFGEIGGAISGAVAALGPFLFGIGTLITQTGKLRVAMSNMSTAIRAVGLGLGVAAVAFAAYQVHAERAAHHTQTVIDKASELGRVADEQLGRVFTDAMLSGALAGQSLEETTSELARANLEGAKRMLEHAEASGVANDATRALADAIVNEEAKRRQAVKTTEEHGEAIGDATEATEDHSDSQSDLDDWIADVNRSMATQIDRLEDKAAADEAAAAAAEEHRAKQQALRDEVNNANSAMFDYEQSTIRMRQSSRRLADQEAETNAVLSNGESTAREKEEALENLRLTQIDVAEEALALSEAYALEQGASRGSREAAELQREELKRLQEQFPLLTADIQRYIDMLGRIPSSVSTVISTTGGRSVSVGGGGGNVGGLGGSGTRHTGGPVQPGQTYQVLPGEVFTPNVPGRVHSRADTERMMTPTALGSPSTAPQFHITVNAGMGTDGADVGRLIVEELRKFERFNGPLFGGSSL